MFPLQGLLCLIAYFLFPSVLYLILGLIFIRFERTHRFGVRCLAMCMIIPGRMIVKSCRMDCTNTKCGNWTCPRYFDKHSA